MAAEPVPRRQVVTGTPRASRRTAGHAPARREVEERTSLGGACPRSLIRGQLRAALMGAAAPAGLVGTLPLVFAVLPDGGHGGWPPARLVVWVVLGVAVPPVLVLIALRYVRRVERNERDFTGLVEDR
ncbi:hypothetical protein [Streptomyces sp. URMC 123]|uniref:hypothetical protein n=1 Tax=Streptomyces sp. URMC 123 TaxID=3423403 RepID=UPI003F1C32D4